MLDYERFFFSFCLSYCKCKECSVHAAVFDFKIIGPVTFYLNSVGFERVNFITFINRETRIGIYSYKIEFGSRPSRCLAVLVHLR